MKKIFITILFISIFLLSGCSFFLWNNDSNEKAATSTPVTDKGSSQNNDSEVKTSKIKIFLIAIDDNGKSGKRIDSGDSLIPVERTISTPKTPLTASIKELLSLKDRFYGESGLYNSLYQSDLKLESASIVDGIATIKLSGRLMLGGELDNPRVKAQIIETVLQFSSVKEARVFINGKTIDEALSLK